jgi:S1-C subfamily serine protease
MTKKITVLTLILALHLCVYAQKKLKDYVVIVKPVYHESSIEFLKNLSKYASDNGYKQAADYLNVFAEGKGFGSGFLVKASDGRVYVITNRHVILQAKKANIEFSNADGAKVSYNDCEIMAIDPNTDLALISFPEDVNINRSLNIKTESNEDGCEVFTAGFPGMGGKPSWQFGKGIISNSELEMSGFDDEIKTIAIQHTAQIDRGSSGGPLLVTDATQESGYSVIGLNTWKIIDRENVNLSISGKTIQDFISKAIKAASSNQQEQLEKTSNAFISDLMHGYKKVVKYVAYDYVSKLSADNFVRYIDLASPDAKVDIINIFKNGQNPVEAVRIAIADAIVRTLEKNKNTFCFTSIAGLVSYDAPATVFYSYNNKPVTSTWKIEQKNWKISDISCLKFVDADEHIGFVKSFDIGSTINFVTFFPSSDLESTGFGVEYLWGSKLYTGAGIFKYSHHAYNSEYNYDTDEDEITKIGYISYYNINVLLGYRYPFQIKRFFVIPFAQAYGGFNTGFVSALAGGLKYGVNFAYKLKDNKYIMLHFSLSPRKINDEWGSLDDTEYGYNALYGHNKVIKGFNLGLSYSF